MKRVIVALTVAVFLMAGCSRSTEGNAPAPTQVGEPELVAAARRGFDAAYPDSDTGRGSAELWSHGITAEGLDYPEKQSLRAVPAPELLKAIRDGLADPDSPEEAFFWLDLFSLVPDSTPGAAQALLDAYRLPSMYGYEYLVSQASAAHLGRLLSDDDAERLLSSLGSFRAGAQYNLLGILNGKGLLTNEVILTLLKSPGVEAGTVLPFIEPPAAETLSLLKGEFPSMAAGAKIDFIEWMGNRARWGRDEAFKQETLEWLESLAGVASVAGPVSVEPGGAAVIQEALYQVYELTGSRAALDRLVAEVDKNGVPQGINFYYWGSQDLLRKVRTEYPQSYLARGFEAYERVRGRPYFVLDYWDPGGEDPWPYEYGAGQYSVEREIAGWEGFLREFQRHPGSDDAAYRLARCYEIQGRWKEALTWFAKAESLPDGDIRYHSHGRLVFALDARVPTADLERLAADDGLLPELKPLVEYTLALRDMRDERYSRAAERLREFLKTYGEEASAGDLLTGGGASPGYSYPFLDRVDKQRGWAEELAEASASSDPAAAYRLGAMIYHNESLYYNYLWAGGRQGFNWIGHINELWGETPEKTAYLDALINYRHAQRLFKAVEDDPGAPRDLKARAAYSQGLCLIETLQWGQDAETVYGADELRQQIVDAFQRFVAAYPDSTMADDALMTLYVYCGDNDYLRRIVDEYPSGDRAAQAAEALK